jgi:protein-S-isoprenylcysteine O-methyltransferase Ste14
MISARQFIPWLWATWWLSWGIAAFVRNRTVARPAGTSANYRALSAIGAVLIFAPFSRSIAPTWFTWNSPPGLAWTLVGASALGFLFTWWARIHLGRLWSADIARREGHRVVHSGPYALVRHPIYTGICLAAFATAIIEGSVISVLGAGILSYGFYYKARLEERFLSQELGGAYTEYAARTPMLVPFVRPR